MTAHLTTVTLETVEAAVAHLLAAGTPGPTLHPNVRHTDSRRRWNGWNYTRAAGQDAQGNPLVLEAWHHAAGSIAWSCHGADHVLSHDAAQAWRNLAFPLEVLPARPVILHPEHTP